jgi:phosphate/phosphite/phosphonate ABC transporter binding protein
MELLSHATTIDLWAGRLVGGRYRVLRASHRHGLDLVYEAENTKTLRRVALKLLEASAQSKPRLRRFLREARAAARIHHPNVIDVFDLGEDEATGAIYVAQEHFQGEELAAFVASRPNARLPLDEAIVVALSIAEALEAAHQLGVAHGAVSASSILVAHRRGELVAKLADFGAVEGIDGAGYDSAHRLGVLAPSDFVDETSIDALVDLCALADVVRACLGDVSLPEDVACILDRADRDGGATSRFRTMTELVRALRAAASRRGLAIAWDGAPAAHEPAPFELVRARGEPSSVERLPWMHTASSERALPRPTPPPTRTARRGRARFGLVLSRHTEPNQLIVQSLARAVRRDVAVVSVDSYARLVDALAEGQVDLAWLPPVAYVRAQRAGAARLVLTIERDGARSYSSALVVRADARAASVAELQGCSAAWVDAWSLAGYVIPRRMLRARGVEPDATFRAQRFAGSYDAVLRAVIEGEADVGAMYCRVRPGGAIAAAPFQGDPRVRVVALSNEPIPGDAICASAALDVDAAREAAARFVEATSRPELQPHFRALLGMDRFVAANPSRYEALEAALLEDLAAIPLGGVA